MLFGYWLKDNTQVGKLNVWDSSEYLILLKFAVIPHCYCLS